MTTETQITVKKSGHKDGAPSAWVLTTDETFYGVPVGDEVKYQPGSIYVIQYATRESKGRTYRDIKSAKLVSNTQAAGSNGAAAGHANGGHNQFRNPEQMFVEALLLKGIEMQSIGFLYEDVSKAGKWLREAYREIYDNG